MTVFVRRGIRCILVAIPSEAQYDLPLRPCKTLSDRRWSSDVAAPGCPVAASRRGAERGGKTVPRHGKEDHERKKPRLRFYVQSGWRVQDEYQRLADPGG